MPKSLASLRATAYKIPARSQAITLVCGHTAWYQRPVPGPGTEAFCRSCGSWSLRTGVRKDSDSDDDQGWDSLTLVA